MSIFLLSTGAPPPPEPPSNGAQELVKAGWTQAQNYATSSFNSAQTFLGQVAGIASGLTSIPDVNAVLSPVSAAVQAYVSPAAPTEPTGLAMNLPATPGAATVTPVSGLDIGAVPEFTAQPPVLPTVTAPAPFAGGIPARPVTADVAMPVEPAFDLPAVPTMRSITIPGAPLLNIPQFDATLAVAPTAPANTFAFAESMYASSLLTSLKTVLQKWVDGANTGLVPEVEQAIWNRERAREVAISARKMQDAIRDFASRGFSKPPGAMAVAMQDALQESQDKDSATSREVAINQAKLEQDNRHFAMEQTIKVEGALIEYQNRIAQRAFDAAKYAQEAAIAIYVAMVQGYGASVQAYGVQAQVLKTRIEAELAKLEVFKSELEAQKLIGELNVQDAEVYKTRVSAAMSLVELYGKRVEAASLMLQSNKVRIDGFAAEVQAFDSLVRAKTSEYQGFATQVQAQLTQVEMYGKQAEAYRSVVEGFKAGVEAKVEAKRIELDVNQRIPLEIKKSEVEVFGALVNAESQRVGAASKVYETRAQVFGEKVRGESARVGAEVEVYKSQSNVAISEANLRIEAAKANIQKLMQQVQVLVESVRAGAQVSAQLAASALSAVNLSGQIGDHTSYAASVSASNNVATNINSQVGDMTYHNLTTP